MPMALGMQIAAASLLFLIVSLILGAIGITQFSRIPEIAETESRRIAKEEFSKFIQRQASVGGEPPSKKTPVGEREEGEGSEDQQKEGVL